MKPGVFACGALALHVRRIALDRGWDLEIRALPPQLHNRPERIAAAVDAELRSLDCDRLAVAYADCGTYGALDEVLREHGAKRLQGDHCYDVLARDEVREALAEEPGTYFLTDFLVKTFDASVARPLRLPELRDAYFANYTRVLWLAQEPTPELFVQAEHAAELMGLRLEVREVGTDGLERQLEQLVGSAMVPRSAIPLDSAGIQPRLAAPGTRARATSTHAGTVRRQITPGHSPDLQRTSGTGHER
jgi:hypothetical protein